MDKLPAHHRDVAFEKLGPLKSAMIHLTFDQEKKALAHRIGAIHTNEETGVQTRFTVDILDKDRRQVFADGVGAHVQKMYEARCNEAFAQRDNPHATREQTGTPDRHQPAIAIAAMGAWDTSVPKKPVFVLATWGWKDAEGKTRTDGFIPELESTKALLAARMDAVLAREASEPQGGDGAAKAAASTAAAPSSGKKRKTTPQQDER